MLNLKPLLLRFKKTMYSSIIFHEFCWFCWNLNQLHVATSIRINGQPSNPTPIIIDLQCFGLKSIHRQGSWRSRSENQSDLTFDVELMANLRSSNWKIYFLSIQYDKKLTFFRFLQASVEYKKLFLTGKLKSNATLFHAQWE